MPTIRFLYNANEAEAEFRARYHRPPPWYEIVDLVSLEDLSWKIGERLRMTPPSLDLCNVCWAGWEVVKQKVSHWNGTMIPGSTEALPSAVKRLLVPTTGAVYVIQDSCHTTSAVRMRMRDLVDFSDLLWNDFSWVIDEDGAWMLIGMHDYRAFLIELTPRLTIT